ncbi:transaldolase family protein [Thalassoglobus polymorphus]|uniref:Transaldolase n=1 Tax=Thalassoglobus polymorphus TaxID=2527994 RepID=A0A517QID5_9PLAN|nr:transaldolase family protein [Thalassoglobus polymorphus]QDT31391.1 Transaldolase [Thalassoglobus polymorphus]
MPTPLESLVKTGTKLWLDSVDPDLVKDNLAFGATGATSNPAIVSDLIKSGRFDDDIAELVTKGLDDEEIAWALTDSLVCTAQKEFHEINEKSNGNDGYVSFELDPLLEAADCPLSTEERSAKYVEFGKKWAAGHTNRMIKVPATPGGLGALEELAAAGVTPNVTLIFSDRQYQIARDNIWKGAQQREDPKTLKSVYSIFISRIDAYTAKKLTELSDDAQGQVGILNAKRIWQQNREFWSDKGLPLQQEMVFASMGTKLPEDPKDKYVAALAGSDIQTNPPEVNETIQKMEGKTFTSRIEEMPSEAIQNEIDEKVNFAQMEADLMEEGLKKFADPQNALLKLIAEKRNAG